jgi:hypothetical protein
LRKLEQLRRKIAAALPLAPDLNDDRTVPHCQREAHSQEATVKDVLRATGAFFSLQQCVAPDLP